MRHHSLLTGVHGSRDPESGLIPGVAAQDAGPGSLWTTRLFAPFDIFIVYVYGVQYSNSIHVFIDQIRLITVFIFHILECFKKNHIID